MLGTERSVACRLLVKLAAIKFDTHMGRNVLKYFQTDNNNDS